MTTNRPGPQLRYRLEDATTLRGHSFADLAGLAMAYRAQSVSARYQKRLFSPAAAMDAASLSSEVSMFLAMRGLTLPRKSLPVVWEPHPGTADGAWFASERVDRVINMLSACQFRPNGAEVGFLLAPLVGWLRGGADNGGEVVRAVTVRLDPDTGLAMARWDGELSL